MKRLMLVVLSLFLAIPLMAQTGTITLAWDANPTADQVTKYTVYRPGIHGPMDESAGRHCDNRDGDRAVARRLFLPRHRKQYLGRERPVKHRQHPATRRSPRQFESNRDRAGNHDSIINRALVLFCGTGMPIRRKVETEYFLQCGACIADNLPIRISIVEFVPVE